MIGAGLGFLAGAALVGFLALLVSRERAGRRDAGQQPTFTRLTYDVGTIRDARFMNDGQSVIYGAAFDGAPLRVFMTRTDTPESVRLSLPDARLLSISKGGELAISLGHTYEGWIGMGTLARSSVLGSAPRQLMEQVREADWSPDGSEMAVVQRAGGLEQLEYPAGTVLYRTSGFITDVRVSPDGTRVAFGDHPLFADDAGMVSVVDRSGRRTVLSEGWISVRGLAWAPNGSEIWFTSSSAGSGGDILSAVTLQGQRRVVMTSLTRVKLYDIARDGRVLLGRETSERRVEAMMSSASEPRNVAIRENSTSLWIAPGGTTLTITDQTTPRYTTYLLHAGKDAPVQLGEGNPYGVSSDGRWALSLPVTGEPALVHPTGPGKTRALPNPAKLVFDAAAWLPDNRRVVLFGQQPGKRGQGFVQDIEGGEPRAFTAEGVNANRWWSLPVSPDGSKVIARTEDGATAFVRLSDGATEPIPGIGPGEVAIQILSRWTRRVRGARQWPALGHRTDGPGHRAPDTRARDPRPRGGGSAAQPRPRHARRTPLGPQLLSSALGPVRRGRASVAGLAGILVATVPWPIPSFARSASPTPVIWWTPSCRAGPSTT